MANNKTTGRWDSLKTIPPKYLEEIPGTGRTAINAQYRLQLLNETFGDHGEKWGWTISSHWSEKFGQGMCVFVKLNLWFQVGDTQYFSGEQIGGTFVGDGSPIEDCYKSAVTDAIGKCAAAMGLGADVYLGQHDFPPPAGTADSVASAAPKKTRAKKTDEKPQPLPGQTEFPPAAMNGEATPPVAASSGSPFDETPAKPPVAPIQAPSPATKAPAVPDEVPF